MNGVSNRYASRFRHLMFREFVVTRVEQLGGKTYLHKVDTSSWPNSMKSLL